MEQFPNIAKTRLAAARPGPHPDAEQLSAFSEEALGASERESVLAHLATCVDCRDIVGLAAAARPADAPVAKPVRGGFRWATFQWAAVAASLAIVTVAVVVVGPHQAKHEQPVVETAQLKHEPVSPAPAAAPSEHAANETGSRAAKSVPSHSLSDQAAPRRESDAKLDKDSKLKPNAEAGYVADGVKITDGGFGGIGVYSRIYGSKSSAGGGNAAAIDEKKKQADAAGQVAKPAPAAQYSAAAPPVRQADSLAAAGSVKAANQPAPATVQAQTNAALAPPATAADKEEHRRELQNDAQNNISKDQQATGASVLASTESAELGKGRVAQKPAKAASGSSAGIVSTRFDSTATMWRIVSGRIQSSVDTGASWQERSPAKDVHWTAIAALGQQVWAGGKYGAVWVSRDAGQSWAKISLTGDDIMPLGDVTSIKVTNPLLVDVLLSTDDDWQTSDGGKSFRLVPKKS